MFNMRSIGVFQLVVLVFMTCVSSLALSSSNSSSLDINWWSLGGKYSNNPAFGWYLITFIIFLLLLLYFIKDPLGEYFKSRSLEIKRSILEAKNEKKEADRQLKKYLDRLAGIKDEVKKNEGRV